MKHLKRRATKQHSDSSHHNTTGTTTLLCVNKKTKECNIKAGVKLIDLRLDGLFDGRHLQLDIIAQDLAYIL